ncbi:MAG: Ig-like domain-containing protein [Paludibacteraceae bacterium]|nr:Ig-like domain-containing protein [Paludibacteraceae bacterium]
MKRIFTLFFVVSLLSATLWAEDVSVTETFAVAGNLRYSSETISLSKEIETRSGKAFQGVLAVWNYRFVRARTTDKIGSERAFLFDRSANTNKTPYLQCNAWEGGIKKVSFKWQQVSADDDGQQLKLQVMIKDNAKVVSDVIEDINVVAGEPYRSVQNYTSGASIDLKLNSCQFIIYNKSMDAAGTAVAPGRFMVGNIVITPYLLYRQKDVIIGTRQSGYINNELINNTGSDVISYLSTDESVATVDDAGIITPLSAGETTITATWEGVTTSYTLHVVNDILAENFSKVSKLSQVDSEATWDGDLWDWKVLTTRRGVDDTLGLNPRIQATALRKGSGETYIYTNASIEGGVKHVAFDWRQWASATSPLTINVYYSSSKDSWGDAVATQSVDAVKAAEPHEFDEDIDNGTIGNAYLKIGYASGAGHAVMGAIKITPWVLYTDKKMKTIHVGDTYTNTSLIDNTGGSATYQSSDNAIATVNSSGQVTGVSEGYVTITAKYNNATTTYPLYVAPATNYETFSNEATTSTYAASTESAAGDACTWQTRYGGINYNEVITPYAAFLRAPRETQTKTAYIESGLLNGGISKLTFYWNLVGKDDDVNKWDIRVLINGREVKRLTNDSGKELDGITTRQANMTKCVIEDIDEPGRFTIRFENHSTMTGEYTSGNKARFVIDNLFWENHDAPIELDEGADNSALLTRNSGSTQDVSTNRTLVGGAWNTLCLPFDIDKDDLGDGANVQTLSDASMDGDALTISFAALVGSTLTAGTPYLVKPAGNVELAEFSDKNIVSVNGTTSVGDGLVTLYGIFSPTELTGGDRSILFVGAEDANGDNLFYPSATANLKGMRAYFKINEEAAGAPIRRARFVTDQENTATGVENQKSIAERRKAIENGQLIIIRDGVRYDVLGRRL